MVGKAQAGAVPGRHRVFEVDEDAALAELELAWAYGGYHGFCVLEHSLWSDRHPDRRVLHPHRAGHHHVLPTPRVQ